MVSAGTLKFLIQAAVAGLAAAFVAVAIWPELLGRPPAAVETPARRAPEGPLSFAAGVAAAAPAVVNVHTSRVISPREGRLLNDPFTGRSGQGAAPAPPRRVATNLGSGVLVGEKGLVLTNHHVIRGADTIRVALHDGREGVATVVGTDPDTDLAVLRLDLEDLPAAAVSAAAAVRVGDVVLTIGNPFGVGRTVTLGIVSATGRSSLGINTFENFIQTDAAINPGNSGGALINAAGELVGINTALFSGTGGSHGIGFAIPVSLALGVMRDLVEFGYVKRGWLGVEVQTLSRTLAADLAAPGGHGVVVSGVVPGSPGDRAGLLPGDLITHVDERPVLDSRQAVNSIARTRPGQSVRIRLLRGGDPERIEATVGQRPYQKHAG